MRTFLVTVLFVGAIIAEASPSDAQLAPSLPALDTHCSVDADCAATPVEISGPSTCCVGCGTSTAGNKAWVSQMNATCPVWLKAMSRTCPAVACVGGRTATECKSAKCVLR